MLKCDSDKCVNTPEKEMRPDINEARSCDHALASVQFCILSLKIIISVKNDLKNLSRRVQFLNKSNTSPSVMFYYLLFPLFTSLIVFISFVFFTAKTKMTIATTNATGSPIII